MHVSDESTSLVRSLNAEITRLSGLLERANAESARRKDQVRAARAELDEIRPKLEAAEKGAAEWRSRAEAQPSAHAERIKILESQLRGRDVVDKLRATLAATDGITLAKGVDVGKILMIAGVDPSADGSDKIDLNELVGKIRETDPYLFTPPAGATNSAAAPGGAQKQALQVTAPVGRGAPDTPANPVRYTRSELREPGWQQTRPELAKALAAGNAVLVE